jgi:ADP-ribosyl-[dinitrogen reductase] hydrolase
MIGAIIGDIAGSRFEFNNHRSKDFELFHKDCHFTDDTVCTMATIEWLLLRKPYPNAKEYAKLLRKWCLRYPDESYGSSFNEWFRQPNAPAYNSFGNGSAMRVTPVGFFKAASTVDDMAKLNAIVTHDHPEGIKGAQATAYAVQMAKDKSSKELTRHVISKRYGYDLSFTCDEIRDTYQYNETCQQTVPQAIVAFLDSTGFEDAIRNAVSIGGDSDTLAAITGGIAEAYYGVPKDLKRQVLNYLPNEIVELLNKFYHYEQSKEYIAV